MDISTPRSGSLLGQRYELCEVIGRGGMATVHRCYDRGTGREVAVKVFRTDVDLLDADQRRHREVELLSTLNDPGLVTVLDADLGNGSTADDPPYLVTELVAGSTLAQRLGQAPLSQGQAARLGAALCRTLAYIHERGIVHRDVKPANILIPTAAEDHFAVPKLVDFGIAVTVGHAHLTTDGATVGTANYLSPEQVRGEPVTPASDIYSLGLVLIETLTGALAYPGGGVQAALARLNRPPAIPRSTNREWRSALKAMTSRDPRDRPDARRIADSLAQLLPAGHRTSLSSDTLRLGRRDNQARGPCRTVSAPRRGTSPSGNITDPTDRPSSAQPAKTGEPQPSPALRHTPGPRPPSVQPGAAVQLRKQSRQRPSPRQESQAPQRRGQTRRA